MRSLSNLPDDPEGPWAATRQAISSTAASIIPTQKPKHRPWLSAQTLEIVEDKRSARLRLPRMAKTSRCFQGQV